MSIESTGPQQANLTHVHGATAPVLVGGRLDASVGSNLDKTGYTLTAGSYSVRASSTQQGVTFIDDNGGTSGGTNISSVTLTRAILNGGESNITGAGDMQGQMYVQMTSATVVTGTRGANQGSAETRNGWGLEEKF